MFLVPRFLVLVFLSMTSLWGAAPLYHAYVADKWVEIVEDYNDEEKREFIRGTLFPDIRYLAKIQRAATHQHGLTLQQIKETVDPFLKGLRLHAFVDDVRENQLVSPEILLEAGQHIPDEAIHLLKLTEDEILYSMIPGQAVHYYAESMNVVDSRALQFPVAQETIEGWNAMLARYFSQAPSVFLLELAQEGKSPFGLSGSALYDFSHAMQESKNRESLKRYVEGSIEAFEEVFKNFNKKKVSS